MNKVHPAVIMSMIGVGAFLFVRGLMSLTAAKEAPKRRLSDNSATVIDADISRAPRTVVEPAPAASGTGVGETTAGA